MNKYRPALSLYDKAKFEGAWFKAPPVVRSHSSRSGSLPGLLITCLSLGVESFAVLVEQGPTTKERARKV